MPDIGDSGLCIGLDHSGGIWGSSGYGIRSYDRWSDIFGIKSPSLPVIIWEDEGGGGWGGYENPLRHHKWQNSLGNLLWYNPTPSLLCTGWDLLHETRDSRIIIPNLNLIYFYIWILRQFPVGTFYGKLGAKFHHTWYVLVWILATKNYKLKFTDAINNRNNCFELPEKLCHWDSTKMINFVTV